MKGYIIVVCTIIIHSGIISAQFPSACNNYESLVKKICCPNNCGGIQRGNCTNIKSTAEQQWNNASIFLVNLIKHSPTVKGKETVDSRYLWPTVVYENVCMCGGNYYGVDCSECKYGYTGLNCQTKKQLIIRKEFSSLTKDEKDNTVKAFSILKNDYGRWAVIIEEPKNYTSGTVALQNVSTYDMIAYIHSFAARDDQCNLKQDIDFAHEGPVFPAWHRHFLLFIEREFQRILRNESFALPYWNWEANSLDLFTDNYFGTPATVFNKNVNVSGTYFSHSVWHTVCDAIYKNRSLTCSQGWKLCNPNNDRLAKNGLQRGTFLMKAYLPNLIEIQLAIAAPSYEAPDLFGIYGISGPRQSFRNRLEGFARICSASKCVGPHVESHLHNIVHIWVGGQMGVVPSAANDPIFFLHHCNVDRIYESWLKRFVNANTSSNQEILLPTFVTVYGGHPGHNKNDWMVPFFPLIRPIDYYRISEEFGYKYNELFSAEIDDIDIPDCITSESCATCTSNTTCINCRLSQQHICLSELTPTSTTTDANMYYDRLALFLELELIWLIIYVTTILCLFPFFIGLILNYLRNLEASIQYSNDIPFKL